MEDVDLWFQQANTKMKEERYEEAILDYDKALEIDQTHVSSWNNKGIALYRLKRYEEALSCYDKALEINQNYANAWYNKAKALRDLGQSYLDKANEDRTSAAKWINKSLGIFDSANDCYNKGESFSQQT